VDIKTGLFWVLETCEHCKGNGNVVVVLDGRTVEDLTEHLQQTSEMLTTEEAKQLEKELTRLESTLHGQTEKPVKLQIVENTREAVPKGNNSDEYTEITIRYKLSQSQRQVYRRLRKKFTMLLDSADASNITKELERLQSDAPIVLSLSERQHASQKLKYEFNAQQLWILDNFGITKIGFSGFEFIDAALLERIKDAEDPKRGKVAPKGDEIKYTMMTPENAELLAAELNRANTRRGSPKTQNPVVLEHTSRPKIGDEYEYPLTKAQRRVWERMSRRETERANGHQGGSQPSERGQEPVISASDSSGMGPPAQNKNFSLFMTYKEAQEVNKESKNQQSGRLRKIPGEYNDGQYKYEFTPRQFDALHKRNKPGVEWPTYKASTAGNKVWQRIRKAKNGGRRRLTGIPRLIAEAIRMEESSKHY